MKKKNSVKWKLKNTYYHCLLCGEVVLHRNSICDDCVTIFIDYKALLNK